MGDGTFTRKTTFPNGAGGAFQVGVGDFNGDGKLDITDGRTAIFGNGDGTFQDVVASAINMPGRLRSLSTVATADFNGDGKADLAVGLIGLTKTIYILLGDGAGGYSVANAYSVAADPTDLQTADFNGDKKADLVFSTQNPDLTVTVKVMLGHGDGSFAAAVASSLGTEPLSGGIRSNGPAINLADFNGDGSPDVAAIVNGQLSVVIGVGDGTFEAPVSYFGGTTASTFELGDFNGDGKSDAAVCSGAGLGVLLGKGDGTLNGATFLQLAPQSSLPPGGNVGACQLTGVADFNNDGASDLIVGGAQILLSNGDGTFSPASVIGGGPSFITGAISDINGDGNLDLVANDGVSVFLGNGDGTYSNRQ